MGIGCSGEEDGIGAEGDFGDAARAAKAVQAALGGDIPQPDDTEFADTGEEGVIGAEGDAGDPALVAAQDGDLAHVEATWVLASALAREARRDRRGRVVLEAEARGYVSRLRERYPGNPLFVRFLEREP